EIMYLFNVFHEERNLGSPLSVFEASSDTKNNYMTCSLVTGPYGAVEIKRVPITTRWEISMHLRSAALIEELIRVLSFQIKKADARDVTKNLISQFSRK